MRYRVLIQVEDNYPDSTIEASVAHDCEAENLADQLRGAADSVAESVIRAMSSYAFAEPSQAIR